MGLPTPESPREENPGACKAPPPRDPPEEGRAEIPDFLSLFLRGGDLPGSGNFRFDDLLLLGLILLLLRAGNDAEMVLLLSLLLFKRE